MDPPPAVSDGENAGTTGDEDAEGEVSPSPPATAVLSVDVSDAELEYSLVGRAGRESVALLFPPAKRLSTMELAPPPPVVGVELPRRPPLPSISAIARSTPGRLSPAAPPPMGPTTPTSDDVVPSEEEVAGVRNDCRGSRAGSF